MGVNRILDTTGQFYNFNSRGTRCSCCVIDEKATRQFNCMDPDTLASGRDLFL